MKINTEGNIFTNSRVENGEGNKTIQQIGVTKLNYKVKPEKITTTSIFGKLKSKNKNTNTKAKDKLDALLNTIGEYKNIYIIKIKPSEKHSHSDQFLQSFYYHLLMKTNKDYKMIKIKQKDKDTKNRLAIIYNCEDKMGIPVKLPNNCPDVKYNYKGIDNFEGIKVYTSNPKNKNNFPDYIINVVKMRNNY